MLNIKTKINIKSRRMNKIKGSKGFTAAKIIMTVFFVTYAVTLLYPFIWMILSSLKDRMEYQLDKFSWPEKILFSNYSRAWNELTSSGKSVATMLFNSIWWSVGGALLEISTASCLAYVVAKYKYRGRNLIYGTAILVMLLPIYGSMPANYVLLTQLGLYDSPLILLSCCAGIGGPFILIYAFFKSVPWSYAEAGFVDGAKHFTIFIKLMLPMAVTPLSALLIMNIMGRWNDYMTPILYFPSYITMPAGLHIYQIEQARQLDYPVLYAGLFMCMMPPLLLYIFLQNKLMSLTISGGLKG